VGIQRFIHRTLAVNGTDLQIKLIGDAKDVEEFPGNN
jgi:hypothetical protein